MDLEERARKLVQNGMPNDKIVEDLTNLTGSAVKANAILLEIKNTENISDNFVKEICSYYPSGFSAQTSGLGCRGDGDFFIHHKIAELIDNQGLISKAQGTIIDPHAQDDGGVIQVGKEYIAVSVDGMHSRLSHFPFIAGFHVTRAAIRDTLVMGCEPKAVFSDVHLANDGDVAKIFDYTAGISTVSELTDIPLIAGSTLRIGGDLVLGDRITGCVGCVGIGKKLTPRQNAEPEDVLIMTEGSGGGTIATTALYNDYHEILTKTLNLDFIILGQKLLKSDLINKVHTLTDITNGGIRGDAFEIARTSNLRITLFEDAFRSLVNPDVLRMLNELKIDPMGISIDSLLIILPKKDKDNVLNFIRSNGLTCAVVGQVGTTNISMGENPGVQLLKNSDDFEVKGETDKLVGADSNLTPSSVLDLKPGYREEPYTPIKRVVNIEPENRKEIQSAIDSAMKKALDKKQRLKQWLISNRRG